MPNDKIFVKFDILLYSFFSYPNSQIVKVLLKLIIKT